ncbi:methyltransferase [Micromonospora sp. NPDC005161]
MTDTSRPSATAEAGYQPTVTAAHAKQIHRWHEDAYQSLRAEAGAGQTFDYLGLTLHVPPEVMPITPVSDLLGEAVLAEVETGDRVLDMGTGSGVNAILAASRATDVVAVDINPRAVEAARHNAARNGVSERIDVRQSDVFSAVDGDFDLIIFDPPFRWFAPRDLLEMAATDANYGALTTFVRAAGRHLRANGRMLIFFGTSGDLGYLRQLLAEEGFTPEVVATRDVVKDGMRVDYYTYRVTRTA